MFDYQVTMPNDGYIYLFIVSQIVNQIEKNSIELRRYTDDEQPYCFPYIYRQLAGFDLDSSVLRCREIDGCFCASIRLSRHFQTSIMGIMRRVFELAVRAFLFGFGSLDFVVLDTIMQDSVLDGIVKIWEGRRRLRCWGREMNVYRVASVRLIFENLNEIGIHDLPTGGSIAF